MAARLSAGDVADLIANDNGDEPEDLSDDEEELCGDFADENGTQMLLNDFMADCDYQVVDRHLEPCYRDSLLLLDTEVSHCAFVLFVSSLHFR